MIVLDEVILHSYWKLKPTGYSTSKYKVYSYFIPNNETLIKYLDNKSTEKTKERKIITNSFKLKSIKNMKATET